MSGGPRRHVRRVCKQCHLKPCRKAANIYCSAACARAGRRKARPLCPICRLKPCSPQGRTCSRSCGAKSRGEEGRRTRKKALLMMAEGRRTAFRRRLAAHLRVEVEALQAATSDVDRAKVLARIYQRGRHDERAKVYYQASQSRRQQWAS